LVDACIGFNVSKPSLTGLGPSGLDAAAAESGADVKSMPLKVTLLYDGKEQALVKDANCPCEYTVAEPKEGQKLVIRLKKTTPERLGVVLLVNGQSTFMRQQGLPTRDYRKWIMDPQDDEEDYTGFYLDNKKVDLFTVLSDAESKRMMEQEELSACKLGTFEVFVFREGKARNAKEDEAEREVAGFSLGLKAKPTQRPKSINEARKYINSNTVSSLGLVGGNAGNQGSANLQVVEKIPNAQLSDSMTIRYYRPKVKKVSD
jgi:hypothetical protein